jgi:hypothetical protein
MKAHIYRIDVAHRNNGFMELVGDNCNKKTAIKNRIFMRALFIEPWPSKVLRLKHSGCRIA